VLTFGDTVLLWRSYRSLSQEELASISGIPRPNLSDIEKGKRDVKLSTVVLIAEALGVSPGTLVDGKAPGHDRKRPVLTRERMESIADAVANKRPPKEPDDLLLYTYLTEVMGCGLASARGGKALPRPTGKANRAWLALRALYREETVRSLIERSLEHAERS
jgi:transcriptional regulator with XRE-family HTH domain